MPTLQRVSDTGKVNCYKCVHYSVSWDPKFPRACGIFGFKSAGMPSLTVYQSIGTDCTAFEEKAPKEKKQK